MPRPFRAPALAPAVLAAAAIACVGSSATSAETAVEPLADCVFAAPDLAPAPEIECGYVVLPESPARPDGRQVKLSFLRLRTHAAAPSAPLFMLAGGPGDTLIKPETLMLFADAFLGPILEDRDVVVLDQRGAGHAVPRLDCPEIYGLPWIVHDRGLDAAEELEAGRAVLADCVAAARAAGVDLSEYNSVRIAADVDAARRAMGYERIVYYGASYGAQLGQHLMRDFPHALEAVILHGANSLSRRSWVEERVRDVDVATRKLAALCAADAKCGAAYDVLGLIEQAMDLLREGPIDTRFEDPRDPAVSMDLTLTERDVASLIFEFQTGQIAIRSLPAVLSAIVAEGRASAAAVLGEVEGSAILASRGATGGDTAMLMHMAVVCSDDPVTSPDDMRIEPDASAYARAYGAAVLEEYLEFCRAVDVPPLPDDTDVDVSADVPTLILAGELDARTPAVRSEIVAETLPRASLVRFPEGTHVQLAEINLCAGEIVGTFLVDPNAVPDTRCIGRMPPRGFVLPDGTMSVETQSPRKDP